MEPTAPEDLVAEMIREELDDDGVELWVIARELRRLLPPDVTTDDIRHRAESVMRRLVAQGAELGHLTDQGEFRVWICENPVATALSIWRQLGRDPNIGEIGWLTLPEA
jgi:hypothetical protein